MISNLSSKKSNSQEERYDWFTWDLRSRFTSFSHHVGRDDITQYQSLMFLILSWYEQWKTKTERLFTLVKDSMIKLKHQLDKVWYHLFRHDVKSLWSYFSNVLKPSASKIRLGTSNIHLGFIHTRFSVRILHPQKWPFSDLKNFP